MTVRVRGGKKRKTVQAVRLRPLRHVGEVTVIDDTIAVAVDVTNNVVVIPLKGGVTMFSQGRQIQ